AASLGVARLARNGEARRARHYEEETLALYDGVIAANERDRQRLRDEYDYPAERILVMESGAEPVLHDWLTWLRGMPRRNGPAVVLSFKVAEVAARPAPVVKAA